MADQKLTALGAAASYAATDIAYIVTDPGGSPASQKITWANLLGKIPTAPLPSAAAGSDVGSATLPWKDLWFAGSSGTPGTNNFKLTGASTGGTRTITFPDASGTVTLGGNSFTGTGDVVRATSPTLVTPTLGVASVTSVNKITITAPATGATLTLIDGKTVTVNNTLTLAGTDGTTITFQGTDTYVGRATTDTLSNKTLASPVITGSITFPDNTRQTFNPGANAAGLNVGSQAGDPDTLSNGDLWYDSTGNLLRARINGASVSLGATGANTALSNLASVSINASLIPQTTLDLGAAATAWRDLYLYGSGTFGSHSLKFTGTPTDNRTITFPDNTGTVAELNLAQTFTATQTITPAVNTSGIVMSGYSLTGSNAQSLLDLAGTWNTTGAPLAIKLNITNTASDAASRLLDLQVGGSSKFNIAPSGRVQANLLGTAAAPAYIFDDANTGLLRTSGNSGQGVGLVSDGALYLLADSTSGAVVASGGLRFSSSDPIDPTSYSTDTSLARAAAGILDVRVSATARGAMRISGQGAANGQVLEVNSVSENTTLSTSGATTDTVIQIPANSFIVSVTGRITTSIAGVDSTTLQLGDANVAARFGSTGTLTAGTTIVGLNHLQGSVSTDNAGPVQVSAASIRLTLTGGADNTPSAGAVRVTVHYIVLTPPSS